MFIAKWYNIKSKYHDLYKLGTKKGKLSQLYARNQFAVCNQVFVKLAKLPDKTVSLRECAKKNSRLHASNKCECKNENGHKLLAQNG